MSETMRHRNAPKRKLSQTAMENHWRRLRLTRQALGLSQAELCRRVGISQATWNNVETGDNRIGIDNAMLLCRIVGVTLDWIYQGHGGGLPQKLAEQIQRLAKLPRGER